MDRQTLKYVQDTLREKLKAQLLGKGPMNLEQIEEMISRELSTTLAGLVGKGTSAVVTCDKQGRCTVTVQLPDWIIKLYDVNNQESYKTPEPIEPAEKTADQMMAEGEVGEELDGNAT